MDIFCSKQGVGIRVKGADITLFIIKHEIFRDVTKENLFAPCDLPSQAKLHATHLKRDCFN